MQARSLSSCLSTLVDSTRAQVARGKIDTCITGCVCAPQSYKRVKDSISFAGMGILSVRIQQNICLCAFCRKYTVKGEIACGIRIEVRMRYLVVQPESSPELCLVTGKNTQNSGMTFILGLFLTRRRFFPAKTSTFFV